MNLERTLQVIQITYPQVYLACHTRHQRKRTTAYRLSPRDSSILAHLDQRSPTTPARLAAHLGVAPSTLSEAIKRLTTLGFTRRTTRPPSGGKRGGVEILLTEKGADAIRETSVLEAPRLHRVLELLSARDRASIARGMQLLAGACEAYSANKTSHKEDAE